MSEWILLTIALLGFGLAANATWPSRGPISLMPSWVGAFLTIDLAPVHIVLQVIVALLFDWLGAFATLPGKFAALIMVVSAVMLVRVWLPALRARAVTNAVASDLQLADVAGVPKSLMFKPFSRSRKGVELVRDIEFSRVSGRSLKLDVYQPETRADNRPALIYLHGGGWMFGDKKEQGIPLCNHMASLGWVCFNANYRLSPSATWPDHMIDAKAAIRWVRDHADEYDVDPDRIAISGGSAGGHIAAMTALTQDEDSAVQAVVTFYGVYDLTNRLNQHNPAFLTKMLGPYVLKAFPDTEAEKFSMASPRDRLDDVNVPWLVLHGEQDPLAPITEARDFFDALNKANSAMSGYAEIPGATHAFDIYYSHRAIAAVDLAARFLTTALAADRSSAAINQ